MFCLLGMPTVDVTCPPGVSEGDLISVTVGQSTFEVALPPDVVEGDTFCVELPDEVVFANFDQDFAELPPLAGVVAALAARGESTDDVNVLEAALNTVIDAIEDHDNPDLDELVDTNCEQFAGYDGEAQLEWTGMHQQYVELLEDHIGSVLSSLECGAEDVFRYAQAYSGGDERTHQVSIHPMTPS